MPAGTPKGRHTRTDIFALHCTAAMLDTQHVKTLTTRSVISWKLQPPLLLLDGQHNSMMHRQTSACSSLLYLSLRPSKLTILETKSPRPTTSFIGSICSVDLSAGRAIPSGVHLISTLPPSCTATTFDMRGLIRCSPYLQHALASNIKQCVARLRTCAHAN